MRNKFKEIDIKNRTYYVFNDMISLKNLEANKIEVDKKSYQNILIYYIGYVTIKNLNYVSVNSVNLYTFLSIK